MKLNNVRTRMAPTYSTRTGKAASSGLSMQTVHDAAVRAVERKDASLHCVAAGGKVYLAAKRVFDIFFSLAVLVSTLPLTLLVALAIKLESRGPVLFSQQRVGKDGRLFTIYKFRSMYTHSPRYACTPKDDCQDARVTSVGRLLRQSGLDELPQFFNVLRGDMSVVGPRPEMFFLVERYTDRQRLRLCVHPGITGPWQLSAARCLPISENLHYDEEYVRNRSFGYDLLLVARTCILTVRLVCRVLLAPSCRRDVRKDLTRP